MSTAAEGRVVVLGLGNPVVSDDRVGLAVAAAVCSLLHESPVPGVDVLISTRGGFELVDLLNGYGRAILIDCLSLPSPIAGRVRRVGLDDVAGCARLVNAHEISITEAYRLAALLDIRMPEDLEILAIEGADTRTISEQMTPEVAAAVQPLAREIHSRLMMAPGAADSDNSEFARRRKLYAPIT